MSDDNIKYHSDQIFVPQDYGTAICMCGGKLKQIGHTYICTECNVTYSQEDIIYHTKDRDL